MPVDGYLAEKNDVMIFHLHGCYYHGYGCERNTKNDWNSLQKKSMSDLIEETNKAMEAITKMIYFHSWGDIRKLGTRGGAGDDSSILRGEDSVLLGTIGQREI